MENKLTPQQELFVKLYTTQGDSFSNATLSYSIAYDYDLPKDEKGKILQDSLEYNICASNGSRLLKNDKIIARKRELLLELFNEATIDARLNEILIGGAEANSIQAIKIANDLKNRITKRVDITTANRPLANLTDDDLNALI